MYIGLCVILDLMRQDIRVLTEGPLQTAYFAGDCGDLKKIVFSSESLFTNVFIHSNVPGLLGLTSVSHHQYFQVFQKFSLS